jgi:hypothetical protein
MLKDANLSLQIAFLDLQNTDIVPQAREFDHKLRDCPEPNEKTLDLPPARDPAAGNGFT